MTIQWTHIGRMAKKAEDEKRKTVGWKKKAVWEMRENIGGEKKRHRENNVKRFFIDGRKAVDAGGRQRRAKQRYKEEKGGERGWH